MNINKIFESFEHKLEDDENSLLMDFSGHPLFWISGFNKVLDNAEFFKKYTIQMFQDLASDLDLDEVEKAGEDLMYNKAWEYIKDLDLNKPFHLECLKTKASEKFINNLNKAITHFEMLEEYEKCILLKNTELRIKEFLK